MWVVGIMYVAIAINLSTRKRKSIEDEAFSRSFYVASRWVLHYEGRGQK